MSMKKSTGGHHAKFGKRGVAKSGKSRHAAGPLAGSSKKRRTRKSEFGA